MYQRYSIDALFDAHKSQITSAASVILRAHIYGEDIDPINTTQQVLVDEMGLNLDVIPIHARQASTAAGNVATLLWDRHNAAPFRRTLGGLTLLASKIDPYSAGALRSGIPQHIVESIQASRLN